MNGKDKPARDNEQLNRTIDLLFFLAVLAVFSGVMFTLFHRQTLGNTMHYHSDMKAYILEMQGLDSGYNFPYPIFFKFAALFHLFLNPELSVAIAATILNSLSLIVVKWAFNEYASEPLKEAYPKAKWAVGMLLSLLAVSLFYVSMLYPPFNLYLPGIKFKYLGVFTGNPIHNGTYLAARPFAILAFLWYAKLLPIYEEGPRRKGESGGVELKDYLLFALFLLLTTLTKPSFTIVLVGAAGLIMLYRMIRRKFRNFLPTIYLGLCFLPTFADLLYQYKGVFVPAEEGVEGGIGFCFGEVWGLYCENIPLAICLAMGFPLAVLVLNFKELKDNSLYRFSWQIYLMSFLMNFFLYEKGFRKPDFNFSWGYMYGIFFGFVGALFVLLAATARRKNKPLLWLQWLIYLWHLICGIGYFGGIFLHGIMYY